MSINYPTSLDNFPNPTSTDLLANATGALAHDNQHSNVNDAVEALEAKVGINGSADTTSHDYKLSEVTSTDKAVGKTATQTLTNKTLTSPTITGATMSGSTLTTTSVNGVTLSTSDGTTTYLRGDGTYNTPTAGDASYSVKGSVQGLTDADTSGLTLSSGVISVNSGTTANKILKLDASAKIPAVDGSQLTNVILFTNGTTTKNAADASATQTIAHGLGRTPKQIKITAWQTGPNANGLSPQWVQAYTVYNGTTQSSMSINGTSSTASTITTAFRLATSTGDASSNYSTGVTTFDGTNISIAWTKTGGASGTYTLLWEAMG